MKKQYIFVIIILTLLYMLYLVTNYKYKEYKINSYIEDINVLNLEIKQSIKDIEDLIEYKRTLAYKNKLLKQEQGMKNRSEKVMYLTDEKQYKKYTSPELNENYKKIEVNLDKETEKLELKSKTNFGKWIYFIFEEKVKIN